MRLGDLRGEDEKKLAAYLLRHWGDSTLDLERGIKQGQWGLIGVEGSAAQGRAVACSARYATTSPQCRYRLQPSR